MTKQIRAAGAALILGAFCVGGAAQAEVFFSFADGDGLDKAGCGGCITADEVTLRTVDIIGIDGVRSSAGGGHETFVVSKDGALGVNTAKKVNTKAYKQEFQNFNPGEAWIIAFDADVILKGIDLDGQDFGAEMTISSDAFEDVVLSEPGVAGYHVLDELKVPSGTEIMFKMTSAADAADTSLRISSICVEAK